MPNTNLVGTWTVTVESSLADSTVTKRSTITITDSTIQLGTLPPVAITFTDTTKLAGSFSYTPATAGATLRTGYVHCFPTGPGASVSTIIGGSTKGDPETVAVWGGDESDPW